MILLIKKESLKMGTEVQKGGWIMDKNDEGLYFVLFYKYLLFKFKWMGSINSGALHKNAFGLMD